MAKQKNIALFMAEEVSTDGYHHINVMVGERSLKGEGLEFRTPPDHAHYGLRVASQADSTTKDGESYGWSIGYRDRHLLELHDIEKCQKTLRAVSRKLEKWNEEFGRPVEFADYVKRFAKAIGATHFVRMESTGELDWISLDTLSYAIHHRLHTWKKRHNVADKSEADDAA